MSDNLPEDIDNLIHTEEQGGQLQFFAPKLHWHESEDNPASMGATNYCPSVEWIKVSSKPADLSKEAIATAKRRIKEAAEGGYITKRTDGTYIVNKPIHPDPQLELTENF